MPHVPVRPHVLFSRCLERDACRYDGGRVPHRFIKHLRAHVEAIDICPEVSIGLGIPRPPIRLVRSSDGLRLIQPETGRDLTTDMTTFTTETLAGLPPVDGAILKGRSPSCGLGDTKQYDAVHATEASGHGHGLFARGVVTALAGLAITDEASLETPDGRHRFLARLFGLAWVREMQRHLDDAVLPNLRHLLALDEALHRETLEVGRSRASSDVLRSHIDEALTRGPCLDAAAPPLYPPTLQEL